MTGQGQGQDYGSWLVIRPVVINATDGDQVIYVNGSFTPAASPESSLDPLRDLIGCQWVDCVAVERDGVLFDLWVDDEGMLREGWTPNPIGYAMTGQPIAGTVVVARSDREGNTIGLTDIDKAVIDVWVRELVREMAG